MDSTAAQRVPQQLERLLVVAGDPIGALLAKGQQPAAMARYYNPAGAFHEWCILDVFHEGLGVLPMLAVPDASGIAAWIDSIADPSGRDRLGTEELRRFFPGVPPSWLAAVRQFNPSCIRAYDPAWPGLLAVELGAALGVPVVVSVHNTGGICPEVVGRGDQLICVSEAVAERCIELGADPARVVTVYNRVDRQQFSPEATPAAGPDGGPKLLSIAREHPQKNLDRMLKACEIAARAHSGLKLVHFGRGNRDWSRWPFVTHFDSVPNTDLPGWYRWADALLLPSLWEGFGVVLAEALSCGTPCITADRAPMNEIVTDHWDGLLVNPEDVQDIARAIDEIADPAMQARLAAPARVSSEPFDIAVIERQEAAVYGCVLRRDWPLLSVVLPTYNRAAMVEPAVRNVLAQEYPNLELIVVNDGSTDATAEVLQRLAADMGDPRLRVMHRANGGLPNALNTGFAAARGEYWTWTSDDNAYRPGALQALARELEMRPEIGLVYADMQVHDEHGDRRRVVCGPPEQIEDGCCVGGCFLYRAALARRVGDYDPDYTLAEDYDYWLRMHRITRFAWLRRVLYDYADAPHTLTRRRFREMQIVQMKLFEREQGSRNDWRLRKFEHLLRHAAASKNHGLAGASAAAAWGAIRQRPGAARGWWALLRALTPRPILNLSRRMRGLDAG